MRGYETGKGALEKFLQESLIAFNNRFLLARNRTISGFSADEQSSWGGSYDFIQLADPQIGMFKMDALPLNSGFKSSAHVLIGLLIKSGLIPKVSALKTVGIRVAHRVGSEENSLENSSLR